MDMWGVSKIHKTLASYQDLLREPVQVVYHPTMDSSWERAEFGSPEYDETTAYNHRTIFPSEVVIEYDNDDKRLNYKLAQIVSRRLSKAYLPHEMWTSGNKSTHVHIFFNFSQAEKPRLLRELIMKEYGNINWRGDWYNPDMQLASGNHLIRAEYGVHEKTQDCKAFVDGDTKFPHLNSVPDKIWDAYNDKVDSYREASDDLSGMVSELYEHEGFQWLMKAENVKQVGDGRKRTVWLLVNVLRWVKDMNKKELVEFAQEWYRNAGGSEYRQDEIREHVEYSLDHDYTPGFRYMFDLLSDMGVADKFK